MSCRVIRHDLNSIESLFGAQVQSPSRNPAPWSLAPESPEPELPRLRERVKELESTLVRKLAEAREAGMKEGQEAGGEQAMAKARPVFERLAAAISEISALRTRVREETEADLISLSIAIARRVLRRELTVDPDAIQGLVRAALDKVQARDITKVRVHPGHEQALRHCLHSCHAQGIELVSDGSLNQGDVIIETKRGNLEASIETQLAEIERGFADRISR